MRARPTHSSGGDEWNHLNLHGGVSELAHVRLDPALHVCLASTAIVLPPCSCACAVRVGYIRRPPFTACFLSAQNHRLWRPPQSLSALHTPMSCTPPDRLIHGSFIA